MACFLVPAAEAVVSTALEKGAENKEAQEEKDEDQGEEKVTKISLSRKLKWLRYLLLGGSVLLAFEHVWHGEVVPWFPFLTAMADPGDVPRDGYGRRNYGSFGNSCLARDVLCCRCNS